MPQPLRPIAKPAQEPKAPAEGTAQSDSQPNQQQPADEDTGGTPRMTNTDVGVP